MERKAKTKKTPTALAFVIMLALALSLPAYVTPNNSAAPHADGDENKKYIDGADVMSSSNSETATGVATSSYAPDHGGAPTDGKDGTVGANGKTASGDGDAGDSQEESKNVQYTTIHMSDADIYEGSLILINNDHEYSVPELSHFVTIADYKTESYRIAGNDQLLAPSIMEPLNNMMDDFYAEKGSNSVTISSAFRDYAKQQEIMNDYIKRLGTTEAKKWASVPGYSEHHSGLAFDLGVYSGGEVNALTNSGIYKWFSQYSYLYGFVLRYPDNKTGITGITHEPWHYRYVGEPHAFIMFLYDWCLEEYIDAIARYTREDPLCIGYQGSRYEVYYTTDTEIDVPAGCEFDISGNNIDGFIVTIKN